MFLRSYQFGIFIFGLILITLSLLYVWLRVTEVGHRPGRRGSSAVLAPFAGLFLLAVAQWTFIKIDKNTGKVVIKERSLIKWTTRTVNLQSLQSVKLHRPYSSTEDKDTEETFDGSPLYVQLEHGTIPLSGINGQSQYFYNYRVLHYRKLGQEISSFLQIPFSES